MGRVATTFLCLGALACFALVQAISPPPLLGHKLAKSVNPSPHVASKTPSVVAGGSKRAPLPMGAMMTALHQEDDATPHKTEVETEERCREPTIGMLDVDPEAPPRFQERTEGGIGAGEQPALTCKKNVLKLYQFMKDFHEVMNDEGVEYFVEGGTLLGAIRHKGLIPWDDDLDVTVMIDQEEGLTDKAGPAFEKLGYKLMKYYFGYKLYDKKGSSIATRPFLYPFMDIFIREESDGNLILPRSNLYPTCYFKENEVKPLQELTFGSFTVSAPNKPEGYLDRCYGKKGTAKDWRAVGYHGANHETYESEDNGPSSSLKKLQSGPAKPLGPLQDRT